MQSSQQEEKPEDLFAAFDAAKAAGIAVIVPGVTNLEEVKPSVAKDGTLCTYIEGEIKFADLDSGFFDRESYDFFRRCDNPPGARRFYAHLLVTEPDSAHHVGLAVSMQPSVEGDARAALFAEIKAKIDRLEEAPQDATLSLELQQLFQRYYCDVKANIIESVDAKVYFPDGGSRTKQLEDALKVNYPAIESRVLCPYMQAPHSNDCEQIQIAHAREFLATGQVKARAGAQTAPVHSGDGTSPWNTRDALIKAWEALSIQWGKCFPGIPFPAMNPQFKGQAVGDNQTFTVDLRKGHMDFSFSVADEAAFEKTLKIFVELFKAAYKPGSTFTPSSEEPYVQERIAKALQAAGFSLKPSYKPNPNAANPFAAYKQQQQAKEAARKQRAKQQQSTTSKTFEAPALPKSEETLITPGATKAGRV